MTDQIAAIPEAGHAVVTVARGGHLEKVTIVATPQARAAVHGDVYVPPKQIGASTGAELDRLTNIAIQLYACIAAEQHQYGTGHNVGGSQDFADIKQIGEDLYNDEGPQRLWAGRALRSAREYVAKLWPAIEDIARELLTAGDRNEADVLAALKRHGLP